MHLKFQILTLEDLIMNFNLFYGIVGEKSFLRLNE